MNTIPISALLGVLVLLIIISGFFSGSETALMSINRYRLRHLAKQGHRGAQRTAKLLEHPDRLISLILLGNNFVNILASAIATIIALRVMGEPGIAVATGLLTLVILIFAEVTPKTLATVRAEKIAFLSSAVYTPLMKITWPLVWSINWITARLLGLFKIQASGADNDRLSRDEFRSVVNEASDAIPDTHRDMLLNILDLEHVTVQDVMVPRNEIIAIDLDASWDDILKQLSNSPHSRLLVFREDIDSVVGFVYLRRMIEILRGEKLTLQHLEETIRDPYFIPESTPLTAQLLNFQNENRRIGLVVDEYGDIQGLITLEDILEEIVGEFTQDTQTALEDIQPQIDGSYVVLGTTPVRNLNRVLNWDLAHSGPKTLNGIVLEHFERFPAKGSVFVLNNHPVEILEVEENRVTTVRINPAMKKPDDAETDSADTR